MIKKQFETETKTATGPFLRFADEAAWIDAARSAGFIKTVTDEDGNEIEALQAYTRAHSIDVVGIVRKGGEWDKEGNEIVAPMVVDGFHVNFLGALPMEWEAFTVKPVCPYRVFA